MPPSDGVAVKVTVPPAQRDVVDAVMETAGAAAGVTVMASSSMAVALFAQAALEVITTDTVELALKDVVNTAPDPAALPFRRHS